MKIVVLRETRPLERRVALDPSHVPGLREMGCEVHVQADAGAGAGWSDDAYREAGATVESDRGGLLRGADVVVKIRPPTDGTDQTHDEVSDLPEGVIFIGLLSPGAPAGLLDRFAERRISALAMERMPRTTRAQRMDALSSQATAAGYRAVLLAATHLPRFFPMLTTAAGTIPPAKVVVLGAGVAGLQAIATARRLGASVQGYDVRAAAAEQVRSLGATFLEEEDDAALGGEAEGGYARALDESEQDRQLAFLGRHIPQADVVISTAQIPGRPAPLLITREAVEQMRAGSVVVDVAAETGGNCALSRPGETVSHGGVTILAPTDLASGVTQHTSRMYGRNLVALLDHLVEDGRPTLDPEDEIVGPILVAYEGAVRDPGKGG